MKLVQVFCSRIRKHGSFEDFMIELARQARENDIRLTFVFPAIETQAVQTDLQRNGAAVRVISAPWSSWSLVRALLAALFTIKPDVVDFHFCDTLNFAPVFFLLRLRGIRIIYHYYGEIRPIEELAFVNRHFSRLRFLLFFVSSIICVSDANKRFLRALNVRMPITVIYAGISIHAFEGVTPKRDFRREQGWTAGELVVTSIGTLIPRKGMDILIRASAIVLNTLPHVRLVIVGAGDQSPYQGLIDRLALRGRVVLTGLLKEYPFDILLATDVYVSASYAESFGLSIAEAQMLGIPVVATRVGGVPEVVAEGQTGLLVPSGDADGLARALIRLLGDGDLRHAFALAGPKWVGSRFDLSIKVRELVAAIVAPSLS